MPQNNQPVVQSGSVITGQGLLLKKFIQDVQLVKDSPGRIVAISILQCEGEDIVVYDVNSIIDPPEASTVARIQTVDSVNQIIHLDFPMSNGIVIDTGSSIVTVCYC